MYEYMYRNHFSSISHTTKMESATPPLKSGDICLDCQHKGVESRLRYFLINLEEESLLKCESDSCMYPYNDDISSDGEQENGGTEFYEPDTVFMDLPSTTTTVLSQPNEFLHNVQQQLQQGTTAATDIFQQPDKFCSTQQNLEVENNQKCKEIPIKPEKKAVQLVGESILFQFKTKTPPKSTMQQQLKMEHDNNSNEIVAIKPDRDNKAASLPSASTISQFKTKPTVKSTKRTAPRKPVKKENLIKSDVNDESTLFQFKTKTPVQQKPKVEIHSKTTIKKETKHHAAEGSSSTEQVKGETIRSSIEGIPKASLIKGHQFLKQVEATKKTFFNPKVKRCKNSIQKTLREQQSSSEDEKGNTRKHKR